MAFIMFMSMIILYNLFVFSTKSLFQFVIELVTYHTDWIHYLHILYSRVPTLKEYFDDR